MCLSASAFAQDRTLINNDWLFTFGSAVHADDLGHGTDYFTYVTKGGYPSTEKVPTAQDYDDTSWKKVSLPHDWVVDLPFSAEASHSHGYKTVGWKYPESSVGWYRKHIYIPEEDRGKHITVEFEGIFRDSEVFCNDFYLGHERSGYASRVYDITEAIDYGADNVIAVRVDASIEEGWFYEGAGIYRNVYLAKADPLCMEPYGLATSVSFDGEGLSSSVVTMSASVRNYDIKHRGAQVSFTLYDAEGREVASDASFIKDLAPRKQSLVGASLPVTDPHLWSLADPYLYTLETRIGDNVTRTRIGIRKIEFTHDNGLLLNGRRVQMKGCDVHLDHAGTGVAVPDGLWRYRLNTLASYGFNTIRCSHNPATPAMLDLCDEMGFLVIDENRLMGTSDEQLELLDRMIRRDRNHPSVVLWSIGNEEWGYEWKPRGTDIAAVMTAHAHNADPTRMTIYASSSGQYPNYGCDVFGYNYIVQNPVMENFAAYPNGALGTEETTGSGTRGKYATVPEEGWMAPINRTGVPVDLRYSADNLNVIERGWRFYNSHPQFAGVCYWTGFDYRGEPNPMTWPATGSQFGILDYCGFPKDEAFYLKSWWTDEPVLHICGPYDGEVWVYSNCEKVQLFADGRSLGTKSMARDGHLAWKVPAGAKVFTAKGVNGRRSVASARWPELIKGTAVQLSKEVLANDGQDIVVLDITSDQQMLDVTVSGAEFLGWGNGNPGFKSVERPQDSSGKLRIESFEGRCQVIIRSRPGHEGPASVNINDQIIQIAYID